MNNFKSYFLGKAATYWVNAKHDMQVAQLLIEYLKNGKIPGNGADIDRAKNFVSLAENDKEVIIGVVYTLILANGLMDYWFGFFLARLVHGKSPSIIEEFEKYLGQHNANRPWINMILGNKKSLKEDSEIFELPEISVSVLKKSAIAVQKANISVNMNLVAKISECDKSVDKVYEILDYGDKNSVNADIFIKAAASTQKAASFWDRIFAVLLCFPLNF